MKLFSTFLIALSTSALATSPECVGITGVSTNEKVSCAEQCEAALKKAKANNKQEAKSDDPKALANAAASLHKEMIGLMDATCDLPVMTTKPTVAPWYKSVWFICLVSVIAVLALLGAVYHLMGHPGMDYAGEGRTTDDAANNVERNAIPEDAERLM